MKKIWILLLVIFIAIASIYLIIPATMFIQTQTNVGVTRNGVDRIFKNDSLWDKAFQAKRLSANSFLYENDTIVLEQHLYNSYKIQINHQPTLLYFINAKKDSTLFRWETIFVAGNNPIKRVTTHNKAVQVQQTINSLLANLKLFLNNKQNVYELTINRVSTTDTLLMATKKTFSYEPHTKDIYALIEKVQQFITSKNARQNGNPIYHISQMDSTHYNVMVAVPTNTILADEKEFSFKRMIPGSFITTEVKGNEQKVLIAQKNLQLFFQDYGHVAMAIDFIKLVTDRTKENDSTKWVTQIYMPVY